MMSKFGIPLMKSQSLFSYVQVVRSSFVLLGLIIFASAGYPQTFERKDNLKIVQECNPNQERCCFNLEGKPVPPGSKRGPYTCLPNGTWG
jgi:hypothetical protein